MKKTMPFFMRANGGQIFNVLGQSRSLQYKNFWRCFSIGQISGEQSRFQNRRTHGNKERISKVVLEKFIKHSRMDATLVMRVPFNIQVSTTV